jgi:hypothetical protein
MALAAGTRLGPYEVVSPLGVGGIGEVYRATDTILKRQVALKVLPASVAGDVERLARFQREAEVLAALNHPHIAHIYGVERAEGQTALVMELVESCGHARDAGPCHGDDVVSLLMAGQCARAAKRDVGARRGGAGARSGAHLAAPERHLRNDRRRHVPR